MSLSFRYVTDLPSVEEEVSRPGLCLLYVKSPDCGVCGVMLSRIGDMLSRLGDVEEPAFHALCCDIGEVPALAGRFLVLSSPAVLLFLGGKEVYRAAGFIDVAQLRGRVSFFIEVLGEQAQ